MKQCGFCELKKVCERKLGQHGMPPCAANTGGTQPTSTNSAMDAIALLKSLLCAHEESDEVNWWDHNYKHLCEVVQQHQ